MRISCELFLKDVISPMIAILGINIRNVRK